jgi:Ca2+/Na+ antiporter
LAAGWGFISLSLYASISEFSSIVFGEILHGIFAMAGLLSGLAIFLAGIWVSERFSTIDNESEPLSQDEEALVRTILSRRIGGDLDGN